MNMEHQNTQQIKNKIEASLLGFAVGDALGVPVEFINRERLAAHPVSQMCGGGSHGQPAGTWSDDTSMTLCMMDSLAEKGIDYADQMNRFADWLWNGTNTAHGETFDVGITTKNAVLSFGRGTPALECGETAEFSCGNGSLMRMLPVAWYLMKKGFPAKLTEETAAVIHNASKCTHAHPRCLLSCGIYCSVVFALFLSHSLEEAITMGISSALDYYQAKPAFQGFLPEFAPLRELASWPGEKLSGSGYVLHTLQSSLWCLLHSTCYRDCVLTAVNLGEDTDTTAAVAGGLAGLWYGTSSIPEQWLSALAKREELSQRAQWFWEKI